MYLFLTKPRGLFNQKIDTGRVCAVFYPIVRQKAFILLGVLAEKKKSKQRLQFLITTEAPHNPRIEGKT